MTPEIGPPQPGWRFWLRSGTYLRAPFRGTEPAGPVVDAECVHVPRWTGCLCGLHYVSGPEELFDYPNFRWWLRPELLETLDLSRPEGLNALATARLPFAVTFGAAEGTFGVDSHTFNPDAPQPLGTTLRATRYRILAVMAPDAAGPTRRGLRGRYGCPVVADVSLESCRRVEAELCTAVHS